MRALFPILFLAACGDGSSAKPDAPVTPTPDAPPDMTPPTGGLVDADPTFGTSGTVTLTGSCAAFAVDAHDRPLVLTTDASGNATLVRLDTSGHPDTAFGSHTIGSDPINLATLYVLPSGKLLVAGMVAHGNQILTAHLYRLTADGSSIDLDVALPDSVRPIFGVAERADGGLDIVGVGSTATTAFSFARVTAAGTLDTSFGDNGVAAPATPNIPPGYFPHAVSLGNGSFALSGASFKQINTQGGYGPVVAHLMLATDGAITSTTTTDDTQVLALAAHGAKLYALTDAFPSTTGAITRFDDALTADTAFTTAEASPFDARFGIYSGGALAVASDGSLIATNGKTLDRFHADGTTRSTDTYDFTYCGLAFDSMHRPLVASTTAVLRLVP